MRPRRRRKATPAGVAFRSEGEGGLVVELGDAIDPALNARVHRLARAVQATLADRILEVVPTYRSLLVRHDPQRVPRRGLVRAIAALVPALPARGARAAGARVVQVPTCYGGALGPDLDEVARHAGLVPAEVAALHAGATYQVYMLGFTPGFPYLGGMPARLATPRLAAPRPRVAAGSIGIGGAQTGIYPVDSPGGWRIVGRTPLRLFDPGAAAPFLLAPGDRLRFVPIARAAFDDLARAAPPARPPAGPDGSALSTPEGARPGAVTVLRPGLLTTVQDAGRPGWLAFGMPLAGAMDAEAYALANLLAGNAPGAAALEMTLLGATLRFEADAYVAVAGADMRATLDGAPVAAGSAFPVARGNVLAFGPAADGCRAYLALRGGVDVAPFLGSRATYARAGVGGLAGRPLRAGDAIPVGPSAGPPPPARRLPAGALRSLGAGPGPGAAMGRPPRELSLRVVPGPQDHRFTREGLATFLGSPYTVTNRNDRMGYQLDGPPVHHRDGADIVSDALLPGAVQVPGSGTPIVMGADAQTVGGYAKIATVIGADLPRLAQAVRGDVVRFVRCSEAEAVRALAAARAHLQAVARALGEPSPDGRAP